MREPSFPNVPDVAMKENPKNIRVELRKKFLLSIIFAGIVLVGLRGKPYAPAEFSAKNTPAEFSTKLRNTISIPLNKEGTMTNDIISIDHSPVESAIFVHLESTARCRNPYLRGRLSGPALVVLDWSQSSTSSGSILKGTYQVPISGTYLLEIIVITCQNFVEDTNFDFTSTCVEDPTRHRLTRTNVKIQATANIPHDKRTGFWMHQQDERAANNDYAALYTRFQPRGCVRIDDPAHEYFEVPPPHCIEPTDLNRFEPYNTFQYYNGNRPRPFFSVNDLKKLHNTSICLVGHSHSRTLRASMEGHHNMTVENINVKIVWVRARFPQDVNNKTILGSIVGKCDKVVIAVGQWPASFSGGKPTLTNDYYNKIKKMFQRLQSFLDPGVEIIARSIHYNPLNQWIFSCPPKDWRHPPVIDAYNAVIRQAVKETRTGPNVPRVHFVDTNFIVGPFWDAASDWRHVFHLASHVEGLYLAAVALGLTDPFFTR